jgi:hypothetical protein
MPSPFDRNWTVMFGALNVVNAPNSLPFGPKANLTITGGDPPKTFAITPEHGGGPYNFDTITVDGNVITATGKVEHQPPPAVDGAYTFLAYFNNTFSHNAQLLVGVYSWAPATGTPGDDPPDTGGWLGGSTNPGTPQKEG